MNILKLFGFGKTDKVIEPKQYCTNCRFSNGKYSNCWVGTHYAEQGLNRSCIKGELWEGQAVLDAKIKTCKACKADVTNAEYYGEQVWGKWVYWCPKCYKADFISQVNSSPMAINKYIKIYGKTPDQVLNKS